MKRDLWIAWILRLLLGGLFIAASVPKLLDPAAFSLAVFRYHLLPDQLVNLAGIYFPWIELTAGLALLALPRYRPAALAIILGLLVMFTGAIALSMVRGINIACGCFSLAPEAHTMSWFNLLRNAALILLTVLAWARYHRQESHAKQTGTTAD